MRTSISRRLFILIIATVLGISLLILLANSLLLKPLYYSFIKKTMQHAMETLSDIDYTAQWSVWSDEIKIQTAGSAYDVVVRDEDEVLYSDSREFGLAPQQGSGENKGTDTSESEPPAASNAQVPEDGDQEYPNGPVMTDRFPFMESTDSSKNWEQIDDKTAMGIITEPKTGIQMLICTRRMDSGITIILMQAVEPVNQSIGQANILLIVCAGITLGISALVVFKLSRRFTEPIRQIKAKVGSIAALDFGVPCSIKTGDELESLGNDVNFLGEKLKNALDTLRAQNEQLEKDIVAQRQFISNASHELRTPLSLIKGYADEMRTGYVGDASHKEMYIAIIAEEAAKMNRLLKEMLELSRMESGRIALQMETLPVCERIRAFLDKYDGYIVENRLNVHLNCASDVSSDVCGIFDPMCFEQVLANYLSNAARYGNSEKRVDISVQDRGDSVRVAVFNTGDPIAEEMISHIWDGFYKADSARTRNGDSYGLGLSIVKAIQNASGQQYGVRNEADGVEFWFDVRSASFSKACKE